MKLRSLIGADESRLFQIARRTIWFGLAFLGTSLLSFVTVTYLARTLGPESFGRWQIAAAVGAYLVVLSTFGMVQYGTWAIAKNPAAARTTAWLITRARVIFGGVILAAWTSGAQLLSVPAEAKQLLIIVPIAAVARSLWPDWVLQGLGKATEYATWTLAYAFSGTVMILWLVSSAEDAIAVPLIQLSAASSIGIACWIATVAKLPPSQAQSGLPLMELSRVVIPIGVAALMIQALVNMDYLIIAIFRSEVETALYSAASTMVLFVQGLGLAVHTALFPILTERSARGASVEHLIRRLGSHSLFVTIPIALTFAALAPEIVDIIYGSRYAGAAAPLRILAVQLPLAIYATFYTNLVLARGSGGAYGRLFVAGAALNLALNLLTVPRFGTVAAAVTMVLSILLVLVLAVREIEFGVALDGKWIVATCAGCVCLLVALTLGADLPLPARLGIAILVYAGTALSTAAAITRTPWLRSSDADVPTGPTR